MDFVWEVNVVILVDEIGVGGVGLLGVLNCLGGVLL